ncbi:uncharacterized protein LOC144477779, partial [Augochlora pura]
AIAAEEKRTATRSFELRQNESKEIKNNGESSGDSDDLFDVPTQKVNLKNKNSSMEQGDISKDSVDFDTPTQVIEMHKPENTTEKSNLDMDTETQLIEVNEPVSNLVQKDTDDIDDLMPTQIIPSVEAFTNVNLAKDNTKHSKEKEKDDVQYDAPTQIIPEKFPICNKPLPKNPDQLNPQLVEEFSIEDLDYEMAPTQLLTDIEEKKKAMSSKNKRKSRNSKKVNLDDTLERNMSEMFDGANEDMEDQPQISTQVLTNILQLSQSEEKSTDLNIDKETPRSNRVSTSGVRNRSPATKQEVSPILASKKSRRSSLRKATNHNDSQEYFSNLTSTRKRNILVDSQDNDSFGEDTADTKSEVENKSVNTIVNVENIAPAALLPVSENSPLRRLSRQNKTEELNTFKLVMETTESSKSNRNVTEDSSKGDEISNTSVDAGPSEHSATTLESDEEDIMSGLPEVRISGTLSNPPSPTSLTKTQFKFYTRNMKPKSGVKKAETKKKGPQKKSTRKSVARMNVENNKKNSKSRTAEISVTFDNFEVNRVPMTIPESNECEIIETIPPRRMSSRKSLQGHPNPPQEKVNKEITKEAEPARKTALRELRGVKRSLSSTGVTENTVVKKFKENVNEKTPVATKGRKSNARSVPTTRSSSANILDYIMRKDSPVFNSDSSQQSFSSTQINAEAKKLKIMVT